MNQAWYAATIILKSDVAGEPTDPNEWTCLEQISVLRAPDREMAYKKAMEIGKSSEQIYLNSEGEKVHGMFVGLEGLDELSSKVIRDGTAIWGRIIHTESPEALVVEKDDLGVFCSDEIRDVTADEIIGSSDETRLIYYRMREKP